MSNYKTNQNELKELLKSFSRKTKIQEFTLDINRNEFVLFGAGNLGKKVFQKLKELGVEPRAFVDNNSQKWGETVDGITILSPNEAVTMYGTNAIFIVTIWGAGNNHLYTQTQQQLIQMGCQRVVSFIQLFWRYPDLFLPYYCLDLPNKIITQKKSVSQAFSLFADEASRHEYLTQIQWRLFLDFDNHSTPTPEDQYFPHDLIHLDENEFFVDCGAFCGDTINRFLCSCQGNFRQIDALEPDPYNYRELQSYLATLPPDITKKIDALPLAVSHKPGRMRFQTKGVSSYATKNGNIAVKTVRLDDLLADKTPTYIKMDIEGSELKAIIGAKGIIQSLRPMLAISVYHIQNHLWRIPLLLKSLYGGYRLYLRSHDAEGWDLVCYAIPETRLMKL